MLARVSLHSPSPSAVATPDGNRSIGVPLQVRERSDDQWLCSRRVFLLPRPGPQSRVRGWETFSDSRQANEVTATVHEVGDKSAIESTTTRGMVPEISSLFSVRFFCKDVSLVVRVEPLVTVSCLSFSGTPDDPRSRPVDPRSE